MDQCHGGHPVLALIESGLQTLIGEGGRLQAQQTCNHLQVVLHPVVHLLDQHVDPFVGLLQLLLFVQQGLGLLVVP